MTGTSFGGGWAVSGPHGFAGQRGLSKDLSWSQEGGAPGRCWAAPCHPGCPSSGLHPVGVRVGDFNCIFCPRRGGRGGTQESWRRLPLSGTAPAWPPSEHHSQLRIPLADWPPPPWGHKGAECPDPSLAGWRRAAVWPPQCKPRGPQCPRGQTLSVWGTQMRPRAAAPQGCCHHGKPTGGTQNQTGPWTGLCVLLLALVGTWGAWGFQGSGGALEPQWGMGCGPQGGASWPASRFCPQARVCASSSSLSSQGQTGLFVPGRGVRTDTANPRPVKDALCQWPGGGGGLGSPGCESGAPRTRFPHLKEVGQCGAPSGGVLMVG